MFIFYKQTLIDNTNLRVHRLTKAKFGLTGQITNKRRGKTKPRTFLMNWKKGFSVHKASADDHLADDSY